MNLSQIHRTAKMIDLNLFTHPIPCPVKGGGGFIFVKTNQLIL